MPRNARITYPGAIYLVTVHGTTGERIFRDVRDKEMCLQILKRYQMKYHFTLYCYVLMDADMHLILKPADEKSLSRIMQGINLTHTMYYNWRHKQKGHIFGDRFKSVIVEKDSHLALLTRYIHMEPVIAGLAAHPAEYPWSSCGDYLNSEWPKCRFHGMGPRVEIHDVLDLIDPNPELQRSSYSAFVTAASPEELRKLARRVKKAEILGTSAFAARLRQELGLGPKRPVGRPRKVLVMGEGLRVKNE